MLRLATGSAAWRGGRLASYLGAWILFAYLGLVVIVLPPVERLLQAWNLETAAFWAVAGPLGWGMTVRRLRSPSFGNRLYEATVPFSVTGIMSRLARLAGRARSW